jgi:hypothetical protein
VCRPDAGARCLACERDGPVCAEDTCPAEPLSLEVSSIECRQGVAPPIAPLDVLRFEAVPGTSCVMSVSARGLDLGTVTRTDRFGPLSAWRLPALGGWCIAHQLPTGAIRSSVA